MKRPAFKLGTDGCTCASCEYTNNAVQGAGVGFKYWPRGNPSGRKAAEEYAAHVAHGKQWGRGADGELSHGPAIPPALLTISPEPRFPAWLHVHGTMPPLPSKLVRYFITSGYDKQAQKSQGPDLPAPARPEPAGKPDHDFPSADRRVRASARIYVMSQVKAEKSLVKRPVGRPPLDGVKRIAVSLDSASIERAKKLGGSVSAGIRAALKAQASG